MYCIVLHIMITITIIIITIILILSLLPYLTLINKSPSAAAFRVAAFVECLVKLALHRLGSKGRSRVGHQPHGVNPKQIIRENVTRKLGSIFEDQYFLFFLNLLIYNMGLYWDCNHFTNFQRDIQVGKNGDFGPLGCGASKNNHSPYAHLNVVGIATIFLMNQ